jgi:hypothetical protein
MFSGCVCNLRYPTCSVHAPYCHVACPGLQFFPTLPHNGHDWGGDLEFTEHKMCFNIFYNLCLIHFLFYEEMSKYYLTRMLVHLFLSDYN